MLVTARTVCAATRVKSGPPDGAGATACSTTVAGGASAAGASATISGCSMARPDSTTPTRAPATSRLSMKSVRNTLITNTALLGYDDAAGRFDRLLRHGDRQHAVGQIRADALRIDRMRQHERAHELAVAALDLVILLARDARFAAPLQRQPVVMHVDAHLLPR